MDPSAVIAAINVAPLAIAAIGVAVLIVLTTIQIYRWVRASFDDTPEADGADDDDFADDTAHDFYFSCASCGVNSVDDYYMFDGDEPERCPQCGERGD